MKRLNLILILAAFAYTGCYRLSSHDTPSGQPPLANMNLASFKQLFNAAPGTRLLLLLSPT